MVFESYLLSSRKWYILFYIFCSFIIGQQRFCCCSNASLIIRYLACDDMIMTYIAVSNNVYNKVGMDLINKRGKFEIINV